MRQALLTLTLLLAGGGSWTLAGAAEPGEPKPFEVTLSPQAIDTAALKYRLLPTEPELHRGNAAPILLRLPWEETQYFANVVPTFEQWLDKPLDDPAWQESRGVLTDRFLAEMKRAAFRRDADWEYPIGEQPLDGILLPDLQGARFLMGRGLAVRARYHLGRREFAEARECLLVCLANSRHYARTPFLLAQLVGNTNTRMVLDRIDEMVGITGSPNLYWALSTLPSPLFDLRPSAELEQTFLLSAVPELADLDRSRTHDQWRALANQLVKKLNEWRNLNETSPPLAADAIDPQVRASLSKMLGLQPATVLAMSREELFVRWYVGHHELDWQRATALLTRPPTEAIPGLVELDRAAEEEFRLAGLPAEASFARIASLLRVCSAVWSVERRIDALRIVEAIRDYLSRHDGKLPQKLSDIAEVTIPVDPLTGNAFDWKVEGNTGRLTAATIDGVANPISASLEYVVHAR